MADNVDITSAMLAGLIEAIGNRFGFDLDDLWLPEQELTCVGYNRHENEAGEEPTKKQKQLWKRGKEKLYLADYFFTVEKRRIEPIVSSKN